jgi:hypothetical protein
MPRHRTFVAERVGLLIPLALLGAILVVGCTSDEIPPPDSADDSAAASEEATGAPSRPAIEGEELDVVVQPPEGTIAMLNPAAVDAGSEYAVEFQVWGWGPEQDTLVIRVSESTPQVDSETAYDFTDENVIVIADEGSLDVVAQGGNYRGTLVLVEREEVLVPELRDAVKQEL